MSSQWMSPKRLSLFGAVVVVIGTSKQDDIIYSLMHASETTPRMTVAGVPIVLISWLVIMVAMILNPSHKPRRPPTPSIVGPATVQQAANNEEFQTVEPLVNFCEILREKRLSRSYRKGSVYTSSSTSQTA